MAELFRFSGSEPAGIFLMFGLAAAILMFQIRWYRAWVCGIGSLAAGIAAVGYTVQLQVLPAMGFALAAFLLFAVAANAAANG